MKLRFSIACILVLLQISSIRSSRTRRVFVHYLPWYDGNGTKYPPRTGWCYPTSAYDCQDLETKHYTNYPLIKEYSLFDDHVLEYHLLLIHTAGINGIVLNINPANPMQRDASIAVLDKIVNLNTRYAPAFQLQAIVSYDDGGSAANDQISELMGWTVDRVYKNDTYSSIIFQDEERNTPVYVVWSETNRAMYWSVLNQLFEGSVTVLMRNAVGFEHSTGNFEWVNYLNNAPPKTNTANWGQQYFNDMDWIMARQSDMGVPPQSVNLLKMGNVYPGFDDVNVPSFWNGGQNRYILRNTDQGSTMALTWEQQISYMPQRLGGPDAVTNPWVQIVTWNDWPEGTSIEPATESSYGYTALETCFQQIPRFKGTSTPYDISCLRVPYQIYLHRKAALNDLAEQEIAHLLHYTCDLEVIV